MRSAPFRRKLKVFRRPPAPLRIMDQDGRPDFKSLGNWYSYWRDPYHLLLTAPWPIFLVLIALAYIGINTVFALAYLAGGDSINNARPGSFADAFFFSVQTFASIGYGVMTPKTLYANLLVSFEAWVELLGLAVITGLAFSRFSRPTARVLFSKVAVITPYEGVPTLMFRAANQRRNEVLEAQMQVYLAQDVISTEGHKLYRIFDLNLIRRQIPNFRLTWTVMHPIDEQSPLYGATLESLTNRRAQIFISLSGIDDALSQTIYARHSYGVKNILENLRFVDIIYYTEEGERYFDFTKFHDVEPIRDKKNQDGPPVTSSKAESG